MLFVGYFEGFDSQRAIGWRCSDSLALREFLGVRLAEATPDHSSLTRIRDRLDGQVHDKAFQFVLKIAMDKGLLDPKAVGVDGTTLEANAAMRSIVHKDTGEDYREYLRKLAVEAGIENPTAEDLQRFDRNREGKTCSNQEWGSKSDPEAEVTKMKNGSTHLAYKAEHVVDLESEFLLAAEVLPATAADGATLLESVLAAQCHLDAAATLTSRAKTEAEVEAAAGAGPRIVEVVADKGYHKAETLESAEALDYRTYISRQAEATQEASRERRGRRKVEAVAAACKQAEAGVRRAGGQAVPRPDERTQGEALESAAERGGRTQLRPRLSDGGRQADAASRQGEGPQAILDDGRGAELGLVDAQTVRRRQAAELARGAETPFRRVARSPASPRELPCVPGRLLDCSPRRQAPSKDFAPPCDHHCGHPIKSPFFNGLLAPPSSSCGRRTLFCSRSLLPFRR